MLTATISLDYEQWDSKPSTKLQYKDQTDKFGQPRSETLVLGARLGSKTAIVSPRQLARAICRGQTWTPFVFNTCPAWNRPRRLESLFKSCQVLALDFDGGTTAHKIISESMALGLSPNIIHHSFSSTAEHPKYRAIFFLAEPITDFPTAKLFSTALAHSFTGADTACIDAARAFFGSNADSVVLLNEDRANGSDIFNKLASTTKAQKFLVKNERGVVKSDDATWGDANVQKRLLDRLPKQKRQYITRKTLGILLDIETFDGSGNKSRYDCVWRSTSRLARMPELCGSAIYQWVTESICKNPYFSDWDKNAEEIILNAIEWSALRADEPV